MTLPFPTPPFLSPSFRMSPATPAAVDSMMDAYYDSFKLDPGNTHWWSPDKNAMREWMGMRILKKMSDRSVRHFKITDGETGDLVAWARWDIPAGYGESFGPAVDSQGDEIMSGGEIDVSRIVEEGDRNGNGYSGNDQSVTTAPVESTPPSFSHPEGADPELCRGFFDALGAMSEKWNAKEMLGLSLLCTAPNYHRRGAAKALILPMLSIADAKGLKTYLEATPAGKPVYEKLGFRVVDEIVFDLSKHLENYDGPYKVSIMVREPNHS